MRQVRARRSSLHIWLPSRGSRKLSSDSENSRRSLTPRREQQKRSVNAKRLKMKNGRKKLELERRTRSERGKNS